MLNTPKIILVVDDEPVVANTLVAILNLCKNEFAAVAATSVNEALTIVRGIRPDLVLLDAVMPGVQHLEHAVEMRDARGCNVLLMSGAGHTATLLEDAVQSGHREFEIVPKPIHPRELIERIREKIESQKTEWRNPLQFHVQSQGGG